MNSKQKRFADEYLIDFNATQSAIRAGYSTRTARSIGAENLSKPAIKQYIQEQQDKIASEKIATAKEVLAYLSNVMKGAETDEVTVQDETKERRVNTSDRIKAASLLVKYYGIDKPKEEKLEQQIEVDPLSKALEDLAKEL